MTWKERERKRERDEETVEAAYSNQAIPIRGVITRSSLFWPLYNAQQALFFHNETEIEKNENNSSTYLFGM